jgi:predicted acyl esterase
MKKKYLYFYIFILSFLFSLTQPGFTQHRNSETYAFPLLPASMPAQNFLFTVIKENFNLTLRDNVILDCSRYYPNMPNPLLPNGYPAVIMCHGYGDRKEALDSLANLQSQFGYCVYTYSMRGQGHSGGKSNLISRIEAMDLVEFTNFIKHDGHTGLDSSKVLIMGGSQGGIIPYMAACMGNLHVKCIISALASPEYATSWIENNSVKMTLLWTLSYPIDTVVYSPLVQSMHNWIMASTPAKSDSLNFWLPQQRNFTSLVPMNNTPILLENSWEDKFFNASGNINSIPFVLSPKRYYFGAVKGHGGDTSFTENIWHKNFFNEWFNYWLFNINNGILTRPKYHYAYTTFPLINHMWTFVHDSSAVWPINNLTTLKLYFHPNSKLRITPNTTNISSNLTNKVTGGLTMQQAVDMEFTGPQFNSQFQKNELVFDSDSLTQDTKLIGVPLINLDYSSNSNVYQFNFQIYDVRGTEAKLVTRVNYSDWHNIVNLRKTQSMNGEAHAHLFLRGSKIRIIVTNLDTSPSDTSFLTTNPFVLPVLNNAVNKIYFSYNSFLSLPVQYPNPVNGTGNTQNISPLEFSLFQNYPNPFNPSTSIKYQIAENGFVTLKVYDILGRETATLVNEFKKAGNYETHFSSDLVSGEKLSTGIYFYKLTQGNNTAVKKLMFIK